MPEQFTLPELQQVYEGILGEQLPAGEFECRVEGLVVETEVYAGELMVEAMGKSNRLYRRSWGIEG
ncbi:hypothetical protein D3C80_2048390 [compost metagenome]